MNRITHCLCLVVALFLSACVGESGVYIASSHGYDKNCKCSSSEQLGGGLLDVSLASQYEVCLLLKNELSGDDGDTVGSQRNHYQLRSLIVETRIDGETVAEEELEAAGGCPPNGELLMGTNILGPKSMEALNSKASTDIQSAVVRVKVKGKLLSGGYIITTPYSFPISFLASGATPVTECDDGYTLTSTVEESGADLCSLLEGQEGIQNFCKEDEDKDEGTD